MSIKSLYPDIRPSLNLNFANSKALDGRITFTRNSVGTYVGANGLIKTASINAPRFDHDPATGESLGLLIEEQRTNYVGALGIDSDIGRFGNAPGSTSYTTAPTGENTAIIPIPNANADRFESYISLSDAVAGEVWTFSWHEKNIAYPNAEPVANPSGHVNLTSVTSPQLIATYPNGWKRWSVRATVVTTGSEIRFRYYFGAQIGVGNDNIAAFWGHQAEKGSFATSYIKSLGNITTRAVDAPLITGSNFSNFYNSQEGSAICSFDLLTEPSSSVSGGNNRIFVFNDGTTNNDIDVFRSAASALDRCIIRNSGDNGSLSLSYNNSLTGTVAITYQNTEATLLNDSGSSNSDSFGGLSGINRLVFGDYTGIYEGERVLNGHINKFSYYPKRLTNAQLQLLTQ